MYLSAQRVRAPRGTTGINVALYRHSDTDLGEDAWALPPDRTMELISNHHPGRLATSKVQVKPGGNSVLSFIEVAAPEGTPETEVRGALQALRAPVLSDRRATVRVGHATASFSTNLGVEDIGAAFDELARSALDLYANPAPPPWLALPALVIEVQNDVDGWLFGLDERSAARVVAAGGRSARVRIRRDVADDFRRLYGHLYPYAAQWVTNLSGEALLELGGARFVHGGQAVAEWPARP
jgi:hypothetical protein